LKILIFTNSLAGGGAERVAATLANFWARKRWDVTIVTLNPQSEDFYVLEPGVRRISLNLSGDSGNVWEALRQNVRRVAALRRVLMQLRPDVAVSMMSTPNVLLALAGRTIPNVCTLGSERCYPPHEPLGFVWNTLRSKMYGRLSAVVALTSECARWIEAHTSAAHVSVIPNPAVCPLPDNPPRIQPDALCPAERKVLLAVGRLNDVKNFEVLTRAFAELAGKYRDWDLVILGEGPERSLLESGIRDRQLETRIFMPGIAGNVGTWFARADLYVMTSRSEGFPNALAEALAHGLPAVSFDCNTGPRDIIRHGVDGLLVPPDDSAALVDALDRVMGDGDLRTQLAARAHDAKDRFSVEKIAGMWEELFRELSATHSISTTPGTVPRAERCGP
jgi:glycosyltransferase involved in cell wall biosynthesis